MALFVCFCPKNDPYDLRGFRNLPGFGFPDESTYHALAEYIHGPRFVIGIDPHDGGYLQDDDLRQLMALVEMAKRDLLSRPDRWLVWTELLTSNGKNIPIEYYATKENVEMTLQALDEMARQALENDWALRFCGD